MMMMNDEPYTHEHEAAARKAGSRVSRRTTLGTIAGFATLAGQSSYAEEQRSLLARTDAVDNPHRAATAEEHGAVGDGVADDTVALRAALASGRHVRLAPGRIYRVRERLTLATPGSSLSGPGTIKIAPDFALGQDRDANGTHMRLLYVTGPEITITDVVFDAREAPKGSAVENGLIWSVAPFTTVRDCRFHGNPKGTAVWGLANAPFLSVMGCQFNDCSGAVFAKGRSSVINDNVIVNATDAAIAINGTTCVGAIVANNAITNERLAIVPSMIAVEEGASGWTITGNTLLGVNGGGIVCTNVLDLASARGGVIANNIIDARRFDRVLPTCKNPAALLAILGNYTDWTAHDNHIIGCPQGNSNSRLALIAASGGSFHDNLVDATTSVGLSAMITVLPGSGGLRVRDNRTVAPPGGRHFVFAPGDYGDVPCTFEGGRIEGGAEGINVDLQVEQIRRLRLYLRDIVACSATTVVRATELLGDRAKFLNAGTWSRSHRVGDYTEMYCTALPTVSGRMHFQPGDRFHFMVPRAGQPSGVVWTGSGWAALGILGRG